MAGLTSPGLPVLPVFFSMLGSALTAFWIWQFIKCDTQEPTGISKTFWLLFIAFTNVIGALAYFLFTQYHKKRNIDFKP